MLMEVKKYIKLMFISFKYNLAKEMTNRGNFIMQVVFMILNNSTFIIQWVIIFSLKSTIGEYHLNDMLILWALAAGTFGISHLFFENVYYIPKLIMDGKLDVYLTQPKDVLFNVSVSRIRASAIGDLLYAIILVLVIRPKIIILFTILSIMGGLILTAFGIIIGSLTFWIKRGDTLADNLNNIILSIGTYPDGIFKGIINWLLYTIIPVGFMIYIPLNILLSFNFILLMAVILFAIFIIWLAFFIFNKGLRRYSSSNLMSARI
jgi:ABC-2 type transport system permease protein